MNLSVSVGDNRDDVLKNRKLLADCAGIPSSLISLQTQVHGSDVHIIDGRPPEPPLNGDAFVATQYGIPVLVGVADCAPVLIASRSGAVVAAVHAGWRGTVAGVISNTVQTLRNQFGVPPNELVAAVGPCIGPQNFEVGPEVAAQFSSHHVRRRNSSIFVDLPAAVENQLIQSGIDSADIDVANVCTVENDDTCFSYRGSGCTTGRMVGIIFRRNIT